MHGVSDLRLVPPGFDPYMQRRQSFASPSFNQDTFLSVSDFGSGLRTSVDHQEIREGRILASSLGVLQILLFLAFRLRQIFLDFRTTSQAFKLAPIRGDISIFEIYQATK